jgi:hypothetical protein
MHRSSFRHPIVFATMSCSTPPAFNYIFRPNLQTLARSTQYRRAAKIPRLNHPSQKSGLWHVKNRGNRTHSPSLSALTLHLHPCSATQRFRERATPRHAEREISRLACFWPAELAAFPREAWSTCDGIEIGGAAERAGIWCTCMCSTY